MVPAALPGSGEQEPLPVADRDEMSSAEHLARKYVEEAGPIGPRKLFSNTKFEAYVEVGVTHDDNILPSTTSPKEDDVITSLVGGVRLSLGDFADRVNTFLIVSYAGTGEIFAKHGEENSYDQDALLDIFYHAHELAVGSQSIFQERHDATADLGERVERLIYGEDVAVRYHRNDLTTLSSVLHYEYDDYDTQTNTSNLTVGVALDHVLAPKLELGVGAVFGRLTASGGLEQYSEQAQLRLGYHIREKEAVTASVGLEYREHVGQAGDTITPVFAITANWAPFLDSVVTLEGHRETDASGSILGEDFVDTGVGLGLRQTLFRRAHVQFDAGYQNADYENVTGKGSLPRSDNYFTLRGTVGYDFTKSLLLSAFYEHRQDLSTRSNFSFTTNRAGMEVRMTY